MRNQGDNERLGSADHAGGATPPSPQAVSTVPALIVDAGHTPGPWLAASSFSSAVGLPVVQQGRGRSIASVTFFNLGEGFENHDRESYANARLIAAAPDMVTALDWYADQLCEGWCEQSPDCAHFDDCGGCLARRTAWKARS